MHRHQTDRPEEGTDYEKGTNHDSDDNDGDDGDDNDAKNQTIPSSYAQCLPNVKMDVWKLTTFLDLCDMEKGGPILKKIKKGMQVDLAYAGFWADFGPAIKNRLRILIRNPPASQHQNF